MAERSTGLIFAGYRLGHRGCSWQCSPRSCACCPHAWSHPMALTVLGEVARIRPHLARINVPTLVLCGPKDRANLPAARTLAAGMPPAQWCVIGGSGHELNSQKPDE